MDDNLESELMRALEEEDSDAEEGQHPEVKRQRVANSAPALSATPLLLTGQLAVLSEDLALQVLACVSAADLTSTAQTCKFFRHATGDNDLWRPLFLARWGDKTEESSKLQDPTLWKERYMERDAQDAQNAKDRVPGIMQHYYLQMSTAKRSLTIPRRRAVTPVSDVALRGRILRWRGSRGLLNCPCPALGAKHDACNRKGPYTALEGSVFLCESCGWAHLCGEGCTERLIDEPSELLVCPVSGRCYERMLVAEHEDEGRDVHEAEGVYEFSTAGHDWGRAYADGYNCASEEELRYQCGVVI